MEPRFVSGFIRGSTCYPARPSRLNTSVATFRRRSHNLISTRGRQCRIFFSLSLSLSLARASPRAPSLSLACVSTKLLLRSGTAGLRGQNDGGASRRSADHRFGPIPVLVKPRSARYVSARILRDRSEPTNFIAATRCEEDGWGGGRHSYAYV